MATIIKKTETLADIDLSFIELQRLFIPDNRYAKMIMFTLLFFFIPVTLIWANVIPFRFRFLVLLGCVLFFVYYLYSRNFTLSDLGIKFGNFRNSMKINIAITLFWALLLIISSQFGLWTKNKLPDMKYFFVFYIFILSPAQEFCFRSAFFSIMKRNGIDNRLFQITYSAVVFSYLHIIYNDIPILMITLLMGLIWGYIYNRYPNFWGVCVSHSILGSIAILTGLI